MCCLLQVKVREGFELLWEPESLNVCFYYIPPSMRSMPRTDEWKKKLNKVCVCVCGVCACVVCVRICACVCVWVGGCAHASVCVRV